MPTQTLIVGDCRHALAPYGPFDLLIADPPYAETNLEWDKKVEGWIQAARQIAKPNATMWVFGSMRLLMDTAQEFRKSGWKYAQDIVWEKHNGSNMLANRFRRVHEHAVQFYIGKWHDCYNNVQLVNEAVARVVRSKRGPQHWEKITKSVYRSEDGGPKLMRSVIYMRSSHGFALHPTEKPASLLEILIRASCPPEGIVADLFAGSGAAGEAALRTSRHYVGTETDPAQLTKAQSRLLHLLPL